MDADLYVNADSNSHGDVYADAGNTVLDADSNEYAESNKHAYGDSNGYIDGDGDSYINKVPNAPKHPNGDFYADEYTDADTNQHAGVNPDPDAHDGSAHAYGNKDSAADVYTVATNKYTVANSNTATGTDGDATADRNTSPAGHEYPGDSDAEPNTGGHSDTRPDSNGSANGDSVIREGKTKKEERGD